MNVSELRATLTEQITLLKTGKAEPKNVNAIVNAAGKVLSTIRLEMEYARMIGIVPKISAFREAKRLR